jgi:hypothetical protein
VYTRGTCVQRLRPMYLRISGSRIGGQAMTANERRLADMVESLKARNDTQEKTIQRLQRETAQQQREIEILKGRKA